MSQAKLQNHVVENNVIRVNVYLNLIVCIYYVYTYAVAQYAVCCYSRGLSVVCMYSVIFVDPILVIKIMMEVGEREQNFLVVMAKKHE